MDAQKLISVSLGKIVASRGQRGGINLHKNLLVAGVLQRARTVVMMENFQAVLQNRGRSQVPQVQPQTTPSVDQNANSSVCQQTVPNLNRPATPVPLAKQEPAGKSHVSQPDHPANSGSPKCIDVSNKENSAPENAQTVKNGKVLDCCAQKTDSKVETQGPRGQCNASVRSPKRKHTAPCMESSVDVSAAKRSKCDQAKEHSLPEPMQTESPQISNLVARFSTGFNGLLSDAACESNQTQGQGQVESHGSVSCATQMISGFNTIPTPVLALSV